MTTNFAFLDPTPDDLIEEKKNNFWIIKVVASVIVWLMVSFILVESFVESYISKDLSVYSFFGLLVLLFASLVTYNTVHDAYLKTKDKEKMRLRDNENKLNYQTNRQAIEKYLSERGFVKSVEVTMDIDKDYKFYVRIMETKAKIYLLLENEIYVGIAGFPVLTTVSGGESLVVNDLVTGHMYLVTKN